MKTKNNKENKELSLCGGMKPLKWISNTPAKDHVKENNKD